MAALREHFLIGAFADYYQELAIAKREIAAGKLSDYLSIRVTEKPADDSLLVAMLHKKLKAKLVQQQRFIRANATAFEQRDYLKVLYAACALTDEQLLFDLDWEQQKKWQEHFLMEKALFGTEDAGFSIYSNIDQILADRSRVNNRSDLAAVYLLTLTLGFRGKHRDWNAHDQQGAERDQELELQVSIEDGSEDAEGTASVASNDFFHIKTKQEPGPIEAEKERLYRALDKPLEQIRVFEQAYNYLLFFTEDPSVHRLAPLRRWYKYAACAAIAYLILSSIIWLKMTTGIEESIEELQISASNSAAHQTPNASGPSSTNSTGGASDAQ